MIYIVLLYLHLMLYAELPKKLSGIKTILFFVCLVIYWLLIIMLLSEGYVSFWVFLALSFLPGLVALTLVKERVVADVKRLMRKS